MKQILPCLLTAATLAGTAGADTFNVTRTDDPAPDGCALNDCSLREAVIEAEQTAAPDLIALPAGTYLIDLAGSDNSAEVGDLDITTDMEIVGAPSTLDAQELGRIMDITGTADVTLRNLTLQNANTSLDTNGSLNGGAIEANGDSLRLMNVTFLNNRAQSLGGALRVFDSSPVEISSCQFSGNHAANGAAIHASTGITVRDSIFTDNHSDLSALGSGPAAYLTGTTSDSLFERVRLEGNSSTGSAGAVYFTGRTLTVDLMVANSNEAAGNAGGVLFVPGTAHAKEVQVRNARFMGNRAENGGAVATSDDDDTISIRHSAFVSNQATAGNGGALYVTGGTVDVSNDTFSGNQASGFGGAVYLFGGALSIRHATVANGSANAGDAIYENGSATISTLELANNAIAGGCSIDDLLAVTSLGGNVESPGDSCDLDADSDLVGQPSQQLGLQPLRDNYLATPTHELAAGSVARGQAEPSICMEVQVDQVFEDRDFCNSGAVESDLIFRDSVETSKFEF